MNNEKRKKKENILTAIIIILLIVIAIMGFFLGKQSSMNGNGSNTGVNTGIPASYDDLSITVYEDKRCTDCPTDQVLGQLKNLPSLSGITITRKDFSDSGVADYLKENKITALPLIVFSTNNFDVSKDPVQNGQDGRPAPKLNTFLQTLEDGKFFLNVNAQFNPFEKRSDRGFQLLDTAKLEAIKSSSHIKGDANAKITWIEYSDLECPFCAKLHNAGTVEDLETKYGSDLNIVFNHFPLGFHKNAQVGAEILECLAEDKGSDAFYSLIKKSYSDENSTKSFLMKEAVALGGSEEKINECLSSGKYKSKVQSQMEVGGTLFNVTGTPGNVLINNATGEYQVISGAYPTSEFITIIDKLLK